MQLVFISNKEVIGETIITNDSFVISSLANIDKQDDTTFVIDVHCSFCFNGRYLNTQDQGGVIIYRHLLKFFEGKQNKLKVIFYSPIPNDDLIKLKPENYVLKLLPVIECKYDLTFENELNCAIDYYEEHDWIQFNSASENLLSGWALNGQKTISFNNKENGIALNQTKKTPDSRKPLIIDDQIDEWIHTYDTVLGKGNYTYCSKKEIVNSVNEIRKNGKKENCYYDCHYDIQKSLFVISDFYLTENHETNIWKGREAYKNISGYILYNFAKSFFRFKPWMLFTSSNRISNYELFENWGIDKWHVKDIRPNATVDEKENSFVQFEQGIELLKSLVWLDELWKKFYKLEQSINKRNYDIDKLRKNYWWVNEVFLYSDFHLCRKFKNHPNIKNHSINYDDEKLQQDVQERINDVIRKKITGCFVGIKRQYKRSIQFERFDRNKDEINSIDISNLDEFSYFAGILYLIPVIELIYRIDTVHPEKDTMKSVIVKGEFKGYRLRKSSDIDKNKRDTGYLLYQIRNQLIHESNKFNLNIKHLATYVEVVVELLSLKSKDFYKMDRLNKKLNNNF